jgi:predicted 3-demethylubiquinone-9 3-methyltransferase (glyoxalase superfamily)/uncharacterized protein YndB with AHSA1/START domain
MKKMSHEIQIVAPAASVWDAVVDPHKYRAWTREFHPTSYFEGGWNKGDKILFLGQDEKGSIGGMVAEIAESDFPKFISIRHLGYVQDGVEDTQSEAVRALFPSYENYFLEEIGDGKTRFRVELDMDESYWEMMQEMWPRALKALKDVVEQAESPKIYPCLWFDKEAGEAAEFYCGLFKHGRLLEQLPLTTTFEIMGTKIMGLNGGPMYQKTTAVSYFVYCNGTEEIDRLYAALSENGQVLMPLDKYDWSPRYAFVQDRFGVSWQLDVEDIKSSQKIVPCFLFANRKMGLVKKAVDRFVTIFPNSRILMEAPYPPAAGLPEGTLLFAQFRLAGYIFNAMSSTRPEEFDFSPGNSMVVECETQAEIDHYWEKLGEGGRYEQCGWLQDEYGISWQVVPAVLSQLMADPERSGRVIEAFLKMKKFDIQKLLDA